MSRLAPRTVLWSAALLIVLGTSIELQAAGHPCHRPPAPPRKPSPLPHSGAPNRSAFHVTKGAKPPASTHPAGTKGNSKPNDPGKTPGRTTNLDTTQKKDQGNKSANSTHPGEVGRVGTPPAPKRPRKGLEVARQCRSTEIPPGIRSGRGRTGSTACSSSMHRGPWSCPRRSSRPQRRTTRGRRPKARNSTNRQPGSSIPRAFHCT